MVETPLIVVIGDSVIDRDVFGIANRVAPDAPALVINEQSVSSRPGGAALAAILAAEEGNEVALVTSINLDASGQELVGLIESKGIRLFNIDSCGTTAEKIRIISSGQVLFRLDKGDDLENIGELSQESINIISSAKAILVSDYGRGITSHLGLRGLLESLASHIPLVWDPHPKGAEPVLGTKLVTPNIKEAQYFIDGSNIHTPKEDNYLTKASFYASKLLQKWKVESVAITLGKQGALYLEQNGSPLVVPVLKVAKGDTCGAGDSFAVASTQAISSGELGFRAVSIAVTHSTNFVNQGGVNAIVREEKIDPSNSEPFSIDAFELAKNVKSQGGVVVATGGCFDLLHPGHIDLLKRARSLGDCLIVLLNSDDSVSNLKGPNRPIQNQLIRSQILQALKYVDAVAIFDEDNPQEILMKLRPDIFVKGSDYSLDTLPEAKVVSSWGGQAVFLSLLEGFSTTELVKRIRKIADE